MIYIDFDGVILDTEDLMFEEWRKNPNRHSLPETDKIEYLKNVGIDVILFDAPYNKKCEDLRRVSSWKEIYEYINNKK